MVCKIKIGLTKTSEKISAYVQNEVRPEAKDIINCI